MANWSDLHHDLLVLIAKSVSLIEDFVSFGCVCQSWRLAAGTEQQNFTKSRQIPWLMLANDDEDTTVREFYSMSSSGGDRSFKLTLPESIGKRCLFSQGWLLTVGKDEKVSLLHPLSRNQIRLPNYSKFPVSEQEQELQLQLLPYNIFIQKVALSSSNPLLLDYVVMVMYGRSAKLAFCRAGDEAWTNVDTFSGMYVDLIYYKGKFYAVNCEGIVYVCDVNGPNPTTAEVVSQLPVGTLDYIDKLYLVESRRGKLLMVSRDCTMPQPVEEGSEELTYGVTQFRVFELSDERNGKWEEVRNLGDEALFLGDNCSLSVGVSRFNSSGCKANRIYFTDDCVDSYVNERVCNRGGGKDMGVYNLLDGSFESHFKGESYSRVTPPMWVVPTF